MLNRFGQPGIPSVKSTKTRIRFSGSVTEGAAANTAVATATLYDPRGNQNTGGTPWSITAQSNTGWFSINSTTGAVKVVSSDTIDFETNAAPTVTIRYNDTVHTPLTQAFTVTVTNVAAVPVNTVAPAVTGTETEDETLSCTTGTWTAVDAVTGYTYQWYQAVLDGSDNVVTDMAGVPLLDNPISAATASTYVLQAGDVGEKIFCYVTATNINGSASKASNATGLIAAASSYAGPGDIVGSALAWWGLRAYSAATIGANAIRVTRASDSAEQDFITLADGSLDVASIATFLAATTGKIKTFYDQTGNGRDLPVVSIVTAAAITLNGIGSLPCATNSATGSAEYTLTLAQAQSFTISTFTEWTSDVGGRNNFLNSNSNVIRIGYITNGGCGGGVSCFLLDDTNSGTQFGSQALLNTWNAAQAVFNGGSSAEYTDGTSATGGSIGSTGLSGTMEFLGSFVGKFTETGIWPSAFNGTQAGAMNSNQHTYWGV